MAGARLHENVARVRHVVGAVRVYLNRSLVEETGGVGDRRHWLGLVGQVGRGHD